MAAKKPPMNLNLKEGALHKALGVPLGQKIPASKLQPKPGDSALMAKRKTFARNARGWG